MDAFFFEYRDFFLKRVKQIEAASISKTNDKEPPVEQQETSVCARIRPLTQTERDAQHFEGVKGHQNGAVNLYEPRRKINGKPDLNVCIQPDHLDYVHFPRLTLTYPCRTPAGAVEYCQGSIGLQAACAYPLPN